MSKDPIIMETARQIASSWGAISEVEAVALSNYWTAKHQSDTSQIILYAYARDAAVRLPKRIDLIQQRANTYEVNNYYQHTTDEWIEQDSGIFVQMIYRDIGWTIDAVQRISVDREVTQGGSTTICAENIWKRVMRKPWSARVPC